jgi:hypothetical protein
MGGEAGPLMRTPTQPSPLEEEGSGSQVPHMTYLPVSAYREGKEYSPPCEPP